MLNRRIIRIKVFKLLFSSVHSQNFDLSLAEKELLLSLDKTRQLYFLLLNLPDALVRFAQERIDIGLQKYHPSEEEANPNLRFVNNRLTAFLQKDKELGYARERGLNWGEHRSYIRRIHEQLKEEPFFIDYMTQAQEPGFEEDVKLFMDFYSSQPAADPELYGLLEDMSLYWADDVAYVCDVVLSQLENLKETTRQLRHPELFYNNDDKEYALGLLHQSLIHYNTYIGYIKKFAENWDPERIAATDNILIVMGVAEAVAFSSIPVKVTLNEMVEISKLYSTENSRVFVNGILDRILKHLLQKGDIVKKGRGLVEN
ncbi:MAG: transcription antitermination protein NusB [Bacteroidales bacterium]|nr:transcription antitermination protein NusB [Bacteroidales bacterium]